jgi:hypothetical protein
MIDPSVMERLAREGAQVIDPNAPKAKFVNVKEPDGSITALPAVAVGLFGDHALDTICRVLLPAIAVAVGNELDRRGFLVKEPDPVVGSPGADQPT